VRQQPNFSPFDKWSTADGMLTERAQGWMRSLWDYLGIANGVIPDGSLSGSFKDPSSPTAEVGLSVVNGVADTYIRSDAAPALSQDIAPVWTANHGFEQGLTITKATNQGIKIDTAAPEFGWHDIIGSIDVRGTGVNDPTYATWYGNLRQFEFSATVMKEVFCVFHVPHDYVPGTPFYFHAHWSNKAASPNTGTVIWGFEYTWAKGYEQMPFGASGTITVSKACSATQYMHHISETTPVTLTGIEVDSLLIIRVYRDAATDTCTDPIYLHTADVHYQSTGIPTKQRNGPGFYT